MTEPTSDGTGLVPIDEVARSLGLRASVIRYYEQRGLLSPASRAASSSMCSNSTRTLPRTDALTTRHTSSRPTPAMASRRRLPAQITPGKAPGEEAVTWALTKGRHNSESQAMRPAAGSQCGVRRSIRGEERT
jgi:MerR family regulatory protein